MADQPRFVATKSLGYNQARIVQYMLEGLKDPQVRYDLAKALDEGNPTLNKNLHKACWSVMDKFDESIEQAEQKFQEEEGYA
jgi:hypothetical protein